MNTFCVIVLFVLVLLVHEYDCNTGDDIKKTGSGIKNFFEDMWKTVKRPFSFRAGARRGRRRRRTTTTTLEPPTTIDEITTEFITETYNEVVRKLPLPVLQTPPWRGMEHWNLLQKPKYALTEGRDYETRRHMIEAWAQVYHEPRPSRVPQKQYTTHTTPLRTPAYSPIHTPTPTNTPRFSHRIKVKGGKHELWVPIELKTTYIKHENVLNPIDYYEILKD